MTITAPADGSSFTAGTAITFTGTVTDEDINLAASLSWTSDGQLIGTGGSFTTSALSAGSHTITVSVTDSGGHPGSATITVTINPTISAIYVSTQSNGTVGTLSFGDEDILAYNTSTRTWSMYFDGSAVGLSASSADIDAFHIMADGSILLSFDADGISIPSVGKIDDSDIVRFIPATIGSTTAGTFEWYFDGSDMGLSGTSEDVDAIEVLPDGRLVVSTTGSFTVPGVSGQDEDLLVFTATSLGANTSGAWAMYFDGSVVGLGESGSEDVDGISIAESSGPIYLTTWGSFTVPGMTGDGNDIFVCGPPGPSVPTPSCGYSLFWDGGANGLGTNNIDGIDLQ